MKSKAVSGIMLTLLLTNLLTLAFNIQLVKSDWSWTETIYIRADGSIEGTTDISTIDNVTYTLTNNIYDEIVIERDSIVVDGSGYVVQGTGDGIGMVLSNNVTVQNTQVANFTIGIGIFGKIGCYLVNNEVANNEEGIRLGQGWHNFLSGNNVSGNSMRGIYLDSSSFNVLTGNSITHNLNIGIGLAPQSSHNSLYTNTISHNEDAVYLDSASHNDLHNNIISKNAGGLALSGSYNDIYENTVSDNYAGFVLSQAFNNTLHTNIAKNNSVCGFNLSPNSFNNSLYANHLIDNECGIQIWSAYDNIISHNTFIGNKKQVHIYTPGVSNAWDNGYPSGGNYWSNYTGVDAYSGSTQDQPGSDGIGDTSHVIDGNNQDNFPLMGPCSFFNAGTWGETTYQVDTISNSTVSNFQFTESEKLIRFDVAGPDGTTGFCRVIISNALLGGPYVVLVNDAPPTTISEWANGTHTFLYFTYDHSVKPVEISGTTVIPEFPMAFILPILMILSLAVAMLKKKIPGPRTHAD